MKKSLSLLAAAALAVSVPTTAAATVIFSGTPGSGYQYRVRTYNNGAEVSGVLRSADGRPVYYSGRVGDWDTWYCSATGWSRYTGNVTSTAGIAAGGTIADGAPSTCQSAKVQSRVGRDVPAAPDVYGSASATY